MKHFNLLKTMLLLCALIVGSLSSWAGEVTIASLINNTTTGWTISGAASQGSGSGLYWKLINSGHYIETPNITWSNYTNITITIKARTFGGPTADQAKISVSQGNTELTSYTPKNATLTNSSALSISPTSGTLRIACLSATGSKGSGISEIVIKGELASSDPSLAVSVNSLDFGDVFATGTKQLNFSMTPANLTKDLFISCNNSNYTVKPTLLSKEILP